MAAGGGTGGAGGKAVKGPLPTGLGAPIPKTSLGGSGGGSGATVNPNGPSALGSAASSAVGDVGSGVGYNDDYTGAYGSFPPGGSYTSATPGGGATPTSALSNSVYNDDYTGAYGSFPPGGSYTGTPAAGGGTPAAGGVMGRPTPGVNPNAVWKDPINQTFDAARAAAFTPGVGFTNIPMLDAARQARQQAIMAYKQAHDPQGGFSGDPNSLIPRGQTLGGVNQYFNPATGGMFVGNPFRRQGMTGLLGAGTPGATRF